jgi:hypothetical protein
VFGPLPLRDLPSPARFLGKSSTAAGERFRRRIDFAAPRVLASAAINPAGVRP